MVFFFLALFSLNPIAICRGRLDGDSLFSFQVHRVHLGTNGIFASDFVYRLDPPSVKKNTFCAGCLPTVNVSRDTNVPDARQPLGFLGRKVVNDGLLRERFWSFCRLLKSSLISDGSTEIFRILTLQRRRLIGLFAAATPDPVAIEDSERQRGVDAIRFARVHNNLDNRGLLRKHGCKR